MEVKIIDITDKESFPCPYCGSPCRVPPRVIGMEKLKHMQEVKKFGEWRKKHSKDPNIRGLTNVRLAICPNCEKPTICKDRFTIEY